METCIVESRVSRRTTRSPQQERADLCQGLSGSNSASLLFVCTELRPVAACWSLACACLCLPGACLPGHHPHPPLPHSGGWQWRGTLRRLSLKCGRHFRWRRDGTGGTLRAAILAKLFSDDTRTPCQITPVLPSSKNRQDRRRTVSQVLASILGGYATAWAWRHTLHLRLVPILYR